MVSSLRRAIALWLIVLTLGLASCGGDRDVPIVLLDNGETVQSTNPLVGAMAEVSPPESIQQLKPYLDVYEPQVRITSPRNGDTLQETTVAVELQVRDLPIYIDQDLELGPHLNLFIDDQPYQAVYDLDSPIVLTDLSPGTHTLRTFAVRPWDESFKNEGAYDQVTFDVFAASPTNNPDDSQALLTYNQPQGSYGAEPIMLDFYLTNAPLHWVAEADDSISDWRIRCTVNGESFVFDRWQPIYLKGFNPGKNWVKLELIDDNGNLIDNALNTGIRLIDYSPGGEDALSQLIRGDIPLVQAKVLVDPNYVPPAPIIKDRTESQSRDQPETDAAPTEIKPDDAIEAPDEAPPLNEEAAPSVNPSDLDKATAAPDDLDEAIEPAPFVEPSDADLTPAPDETGPATDFSTTDEREMPVEESEIPTEETEPTGLPSSADTDETTAESPSADTETPPSQADRPNNLDDLLDDVPEAPNSSSGLAVDDLTEGSPLLDSQDPTFPDDYLPNGLPSGTVSPDLPDDAPADQPPEPALESLEAEADLV